VLAAARRIITHRLRKLGLSIVAFFVCEVKTDRPPCVYAWHTSLSPQPQQGSAHVHRIALLRPILLKPATTYQLRHRNKTRTTFPIPASARTTYEEEPVRRVAPQSLLSTNSNVFFHAYTTAQHAFTGTVRQEHTCAIVPGTKAPLWTAFSDQHIRFSWRMVNTEGTSVRVVDHSSTSIHTIS